MAETACVYVVTYSPPGCDLQESDIVTTACVVPCVDRMIEDGPCAGATLSALSDQCLELSPADAAGRAKLEAAAQRARARTGGPHARLKSSEITGRRRGPQQP